MKKAILLMLLPLFLFSASNPSSTENESRLQEKIKGLINRMTLEEKVGQMTQLTIQSAAAQRGSAETPFKLDRKKLENLIVNYHVGSFLNVYDAALSLQEWRELITTIQDIATKKTRLGIPVLYGIDAIHGANYTREATLFPQSIAMAATWNPELVQREGEITALEVRASGIPWNFNPVLGVGRHPAWPRFWETYGEDTYLVSELGRAYIRGQQGEENRIDAPDRVAVCMKHYLGYSFPLSGKDRTPAWIPERMLREIFLPPFQKAVKSGTITVMINSSEINGIPVHSDPFILKTLLRKELGFKGLVVTDWADIDRLWERERVAANRREAVKMAVMAGIDMSMVPLGLDFTKELLSLVREGEVPVSRIDDAVYNILYVKHRLGLFENPYPPKELEQMVGSKEFNQVSLQAAREAITLLKNENNLLPLSKNRRLLVCGPTAHQHSVLNGGWTYTWQGNEEKLYPDGKLTLLEALQQKIGEDRVIYVPGSSYDKILDVDKAVEAAQEVDAVILALGEMPYCETPGNIDDLNLPAAQIELAKALLETGKPVILVLIEGRPRLIRPIVDNLPAVLMAYLPGPEGGRAIADVLFGDYNPGGKLPFSYPKYPNALLCYDHKYSESFDQNRYDPEFPFGFGLSYTRFAYSDLKLDKTTLENDDTLTVKVTVKNTGDRAGKEVVQLYLSDLVRSVTPPVRQLRGFTPIYLQPGESRTVSFQLTREAFSFIGRDLQRIVEPGEFKIRIADLEKEFVLK
ncbi:MAG: glycoside hydrolase family 3 N-terminal domain-containing protein [Calditrichia bacterium]